MAHQTDRLDMSVPFQPVNIAVMTVSDTRTAADDRSGDFLASRIAEDGHVLAARAIITDDVPKITAQLRDWVEDPQIDVVITTGGTGLTGRDSTPKPLTPLSRKRSVALASCSGCCPIRRSAPRRYSRGRWLALPAAPIFALPGSTSACKDGWDDILRYQLDIRHKPCNFVEIMPRLAESATTRRGG